MQATKHKSWRLLVAVFLGGTLLRAPWGRAEEGPTDESLAYFEQRVRPVLVEHCYECHSQQAGKSQGGLRLDSRQAARQGGDSGPAVIPGDPEGSLLVQAVRYDSLEMPPVGRLPEATIADLIRWIEMGAPDPREQAVSPSAPPSAAAAADHWAFRRIADPQTPQVRDLAWPLAESDRFILGRLEQCGLRPAPDADRYTWLRRVSFDLIGLPPTVDEIQRFVADRSATAYESVVDRLLASRAFGERWARFWLDLVGYADQIGTSNNVFAEHAWRYRDYVVDAFNQDLPYDRFVREQLAGDLLSFPSVEEQADSLTATGFLLLGDLEIVEADKAKLRVDVVDQQIVKTSKAFLGMTVGCARCHDHKFDPITQRDYYAMAGCFFSTQSVYKTDRGVWSDVVQRELPETEWQRAQRIERMRRHAAQLADWTAERDKAVRLRQELEQRLTSDRPTAGDADPGELTVERQRLDQRIDQLRRFIEHAEFFVPGVPRAYAVRDADEPVDMRITIRGNPRALGDEVPRGVLEVIANGPSLISTQGSGRRELADWIADPDNPLTARVAVNRIWQRLFGRGIAPSVDYFGLRADPPTHPDLLDHLATKFIREGWSQKKLIRSLVLSRAYRMSSAHCEQAHAVDPDNRQLHRMNRRRLDAEALRDAMLAVSGQLLPSAGGPALPLEFVENVANIDPQNVNPPSFSLNRWRSEQPRQRTVYLPIIRSGAQPGPAELRNVFDFLQPAEFAGQRPTTAVPTQALYLMNSAEVKEYAAQLAESVQHEVGDLPGQLEILWLRTINRPISLDEYARAEAFLSEVGEAGWVELCRGLLATNEFMMTL